MNEAIIITQIITLLILLFKVRNDRIKERVHVDYINRSIQDINPGTARLKIKEVKLFEKKPQVYSPRHDIDTVMRGKVIDPFD